MKQTNPEHYATIANLVNESPKIDDSRATTTSQEVFDKAWAVAQKYGYNSTSEVISAPQTTNRVFDEAIQVTYQMTGDITYYDQSAILAIAEVQLMALTHPDVRLDIKNSAMDNLRNILLCRESYNSAVLDPIREATKIYLQSEECPSEIKSEFAGIMEEYPNPTFDTITRLNGEIPDIDGTRSTHSAQEVFQIARSVAEDNGVNWSTVYNSETTENNSAVVETIIGTIHDFANKILAPIDAEAQLADVEIQLSALTSSNLDMKVRLSALQNLYDYFDDGYNFEVSNIAQNCVRTYLMYGECPSEIHTKFDKLKKQ